MASLTSILQLINLVQGESAFGSYTNWGDVTDANLASLEATVGENTSKAVTVADVALTATEELSLRINTTGVLTGNRAVTTSGRKGFWFVTNNCTGAFTLTFKTTAGTGVVIPQGGSVVCVCDGTNILSIGLLQSASLDNRLARYDGTAGAIQGSTITVDDTGNMSGVGTLGVGAITTTGAFTGTTGAFSGTLSATGQVLAGDGSAATPAYSFTSQGGLGFYRPSANQIAVMAGSSVELARFDGAGAGVGLHVGKIAFNPDTIGFSVATTGDTHNTANGVSVGTWTRQGSDGALMTCRKGVTTVGSISVTGAATTYNTSSDKRLKKNWKIFDAGKILDALEVWKYQWKKGSRRSAYGVLAQDAAKVFPQAVTYDAEHDMWQADYSKFVPLLLQEVKALRARVAVLEAR